MSRSAHLRAFALEIATAFVLAACATHPKHVPPPQPPVKPVRTATPARPKPAAPLPAPVAAPAPTAAVLDSRSYEQDKNRIKQALANNSGDALAAADVGYYMDVLQGRLKQLLGKGIARRREGITLDLSGRVFFEPGSTQIGAGVREILAPLAKVLVEYRMTLVSVQVRADDPRTHVIDPALSQLHAQAIAHVLADAGVAVKRIVIAGVGSENRVRVGLQIEPIVRAAGSGH